MKQTLLFIAVIFIAFTSCKKTYITEVTKTSIDSVRTDSIFIVVDSSHTDYTTRSSTFPINMNYSSNQIIGASNAIGAETINISMIDSIPGTDVYIVSYVNSGASFNLSYDRSNTVISLTSGSFANPPNGTNIIHFKYLGHINGVNMISVSVTLQP